MLLKYFVRGALIGVISFTAACSFIDSSVSSRVTTLNFGIDQAASDGILTNIIRASNSQPLTFVAVSKVGGTQQVTLTNGLPSLSIGPGLNHPIVFGNNTMNNQANGNFDVAPLNGRDFTKGLLLEISLLELQLLIKQGISRELLFNLAFEGIEYTEIVKDKKGAPVAGDRKIIVNDPTHPTYRFFKDAVDALVSHGLTIESRQEKNPYYDPNDKTGSSPKLITRAHFCFEPVLGDSKIKIRADAWLCGRSWVNQPLDMPRAAVKPGVPSADGTTSEKSLPSATIAPQAEFLIDKDFSPKLPRLKIAEAVVRVRSVFGIFNYLGRILANKRGGDILIKDAPDSGNGKYTPLLEITKGDMGNCFSAISFNGETYCVPQDGAENTKRVFALISQLLALKTQPGELPFTPTVRLTP
jgi:hypothetical protein